MPLGLPLGMPVGITQPMPPSGMPLGMTQPMPQHLPTPNMAQHLPTPNMAQRVPTPSMCGNGCEGPDACATHWCAECKTAVCCFCVSAHQRNAHLKTHRLTQLVALVPERFDGPDTFDERELPVAMYMASLRSLLHHQPLAPQPTRGEPSSRRAFVKTTLADGGMSSVVHRGLLTSTPYTPAFAPTLALQERERETPYTPAFTPTLYMPTYRDFSTDTQCLARVAEEEGMPELRGMLHTHTHTHAQRQMQAQAQAQAAEMSAADMHETDMHATLLASMRQGAVVHGICDAPILRAIREGAESPGHGATVLGLGARVLGLGAGGVGVQVASKPSTQSERFQSERFRLTPEQAIHIFRMRSTKTKATAGLLAVKYGISPKAIRDIWTRKSWTQETRPYWSHDDDVS